MYADAPIGLSNVKGELVFDSSRLIFENITADSGGGQLTLGGSLTYGEEGPVRYELTVTTQQVRSAVPGGA